MSMEFSLSPQNSHWNTNTPAGQFLSKIAKRIGLNRPNVWYADTFSLPMLHHLKQYYTGTVILYCWWDPIADVIARHADDMDLDWIIITSDPELAGKHSRIQTIQWCKQYGFHIERTVPTRPAKFTVGDRFFCPMRNHKPERLRWLERLWQEQKLDYVSYLCQNNSKHTHGREPNLYWRDSYYNVDTAYEYQPSGEFLQWCEQNLPLELPNDNTQQLENNTDFFTVGNIEWYDNTDYTVVMETYWSKSKFLTEKSFKPILAQHPFVNFGGTDALKQLGFDVFEDVVDVSFDMHAAGEKIKHFKFPTFDIDPRRLAVNLQCATDLLLDARQEQNLLLDRLEDSLASFRA